MMEASKFADYYEILEISPNANSGTIERMFRYLAQRYHPDNQETGDRHRFDEIMEAYETLKDPGKRARYDIDHKNNSGVRWKLAEEASDNKAIDRDAVSYESVMAAFKMPQGNTQEIAQRESSIQAATKAAAEVPLQVATRAAQLHGRLLQLEAISAASMKSDLQVARLMAVAAGKGALANVEINLEGLKDPSYVEKMRVRVSELRTQLG